MPLILPRRSLLSYPAGRAPGVDLSHPASAGLMASVYPAGNAVLNLFGTAGFQRQLPTGVPFAAGIESLGPVSVFAVLTNQAIFLDRPPIGSIGIGQGFTNAGIVRMTASNGGNNVAFISSGSGEGFYQGILANTANFGIRLYGVNDFDSGVAPSIGVPVFYAASVYNIDNTNWGHRHVIKRLDTGETRVVVGSPVAIGAVTYVQPDKFTYGGYDTSQNWPGNIAAAMFSTKPLSTWELEQWSKAPWEFWYPPAQRKVSYSHSYAPLVVTGGARVLQRFNKSKLAYPAGSLPSVDPSHPASPGLYSFIIPVPGVQALNLAGKTQFGKATNSTFGGTPLTTIDQRIGPSFLQNNPGDFLGFTAPVLPTNTPNTGLTFASIGRPLSFISTLVLTSVDGSNLYQGITTTGEFFCRLNGVVSFQSGIIGVTNVPYFYAVSLIYKGSNLWDHNHVVVRLDTGQITATSVVGTSQAPIAFSTTLLTYGGAVGFGGQVAMGPSMVSTTVLSMEQLAAWAKAPWEFWYPNKTINLANDGGVITPPPSFLAAWARRSNPPVLGTGNF